MNVSIWGKYSETLTRLGFKNTYSTVEVIDDCLTGPRYRHVTNTIVYDFILPDTINIRWGGEDVVLLLDFLVWEFEKAKEAVHEDYEPTLVYEGAEYKLMSKQLLEGICCGDKNGIIKLNGHWCNARSQILLFQRMCNDTDGVWWDKYYSSVNDFLR
jgi:hypothetical protein